MKKTVIFACALLFLAIAGYYFFSSPVVNETATGNEISETNEETSSRYMSVEEYVKDSISELSPIKEQLGGTFYVTRIETDHGEGVVEYEDGHNAYTADFLFYYEASGRPVITSFVIREI